MKPSPKLSIVIPVYNCRNYLGECIDSILSQTYTDYEVLLVDDGSTDDSGKLCDELAERHPDRIRVFHKPNGGASTARNFGLDNARGNYIGFVDSDDVILPDMYQTLVETIESQDVDIVTSTMAEWENGYEISIVNRHLGPCRSLDLLKWMFEWQEGTNVYTKLFRREAIGQTRFHEGVINEDFRFLCDIFLKDLKAFVVGERFYCYRITPGSVTACVRPNFFDIFTNLDYIRGLLPGNETLRNAFDRYVYTMHVMSGVKIVKGRLNSRYKLWLRRNRRYILSRPAMMFDRQMPLRWKAKALFTFLRLPGRENA